MEKKPRLPLLADTDNTLKVLRSVRDVPPAHYIMKIESFSLLSQLLQKIGVDKYESNDFEAGGYKWKLLLYPDGNKKRGVEGYISLYLAMSDTKNLALGCEVNVIFKFFVFDQIRDKYLTLEDGRVRRFHALKTERGIPRLLSLSLFNDPLNGYLIDDCCMFGAEISVIKSDVKGESLTMIHEPHNTTLTWKIENFSELKDDFHYSEGVTVGGCQWKFKLCPNGSPKGKAKSLSLYLTIHDNSILRTEWKVYAEYKLIIKDQVNDKHHEKTGKNWFRSFSSGWGFNDFMTHHDLKDVRKGFLINDNLVVEGKITFLSVVNHFA